MFDLKYLVGFLSFSLAWATQDPIDPVVVGQTFLAGAIDPIQGSTPWALTSHGIAEKLFTVDKEGEIVPQIAESVTKVSDLVWEVMIKPGYRFSDGTPVTAQHVTECLTEMNTENSSAQSSLGDMTVTTQGDLKVKIKSERSTHVMDAVLAEWVFVVYRKDSDGNFLFTGPYTIKTFSSDQIDLVPNRYYDNKSLNRPLIKLKKFADGHDLAKAAENSEVDIGFHLPIDTLPGLRKADNVNVKSFEVGYHYMMFHNIDNLPDVKVRKAIDMAIDRTVLSQALAGGKGTRSLFPDFSPYFSDDSDPHGDPDAAAALLGEAGWLLNSSGKRERFGKELTVNLVAYPHRPGLVIMQPVIELLLTNLGITVNSILTSMEWSETQTIIDDRSFDLLMWAQHTLPAGDPMWFLSSFFHSDGGSNHANLQSDNVDSMLDTLSIAEDHNDRVLVTEATQNTILEQVPVSNLVTPYWHISLSDRMADYEPWGADYYVIRPDLFINDLASSDEEVAEPDPIGGLCFSGINTVHVFDRGMVQMHDLKIGDEVQVGHDEYSRIYSFGHYNKDLVAEFLKLHATDLDKPLEISKDHMVFVEDRGSVPASTVNIGEKLLLVNNGSNAKVTKIEKVYRNGAFAPFTESGTIVVNGVISSNYITMQDDLDALTVAGVELVSMQWIAHSFQAPQRLVCKWNSEFCANETYSESGISKWVYGPYLASKWFLEQHVAVLMVFAVPVILVVAIFSTIESLVLNIGLSMFTIVLGFTLYRKMGKKV